MLAGFVYGCNYNSEKYQTLMTLAVNSSLEIQRLYGRSYRYHVVTHPFLTDQTRLTASIIEKLRHVKI